MGVTEGTIWNWENNYREPEVHYLPPIIRFLRNPRMWPEYWEYLSAGGDAPELPEDAVRVRWRRS